jgi:ankyrin repeat protein
MIAFSILNYGAKMLPSGLEPKPRKQNTEATQVLLDAIARDNLPYIKTLLTMQFDLDTVDDQGLTPLMRAAQKGNFKVVQMLIKCGASPLLSGPSGRASEVALQNNFPAINEFLKKVEEVQQAEAAKRAASEPQAGTTGVA